MSLEILEKRINYNFNAILNYIYNTIKDEQFLE